MIGRGTFPLPPHCRPFVVDRGCEIFAERRLHGDGLGFLTLGKVVEGRDCASFFRDRVLGVAELLPYGNDDEGQQHRIDHAHGRKFESGDLVVPGELVDAGPFSDQDLRRHRDRGRDDDDQQDQLPKRKARQEIGHAHLRAAQNRAIVILARIITPGPRGRSGDRKGEACLPPAISLTSRARRSGGRGDRGSARRANCARSPLRKSADRTN